MKTKKYLLDLGVFVTFSIPIAMVVACGSSEDNFDYSNLNEKSNNLDAIKSPLGNYQKIDELKNMSIFGAGSSSVKPIMNDIQYALDKLQYSGTGSGEGLKVGTILGQNQQPPKNEIFGITSSLKRPSSSQEWKKIRTITWGIDAIGIALNLPSGVYIKNNDRPKISITELAKLYDVEKETNTTWKDLLLNEDDTKGQNALEKKPIALGRTGGKASSGTADGFWNVLSHNLPNGSSQDLDHRYLKTNGGQETAEANSAALTALKQKDGSLTYLSLGYALVNQDKKMVVASIISKNQELWIPSLNAVRNGQYHWRRPFNIIYKVSNENAKKFVTYLLSSQVQKLLVKNNFINLTSDQFQKQFRSIQPDKILDNLKIADEDIVSNVTTDDLGLTM